MSSQTVVMMGLKGAGKSSYLAALWYLFKKFNVPRHLTLREQPDDREYLNVLQNAWLQGEPVPRTHEEDHHVIKLDLHDSIRNSDLQLSFPDLPGEAYLNALVNRKLDERIHDVLCNADGIMLFIGIELNDPQSIFSQVRDQIEVGLLAPDISDPNNQDTPVEWNAEEHARTDTVLVDLLQMGLGLRKNQHDKPRIGILISAWDTYPQNCLPSEILKVRYPLLYQYIKSHEENYISQVFGISAQGCNYENAVERETALNRINSIDRIVVVHETSTMQDLTQTLSWMME